MWSTSLCKSKRIHWIVSSHFDFMNNYHLSLWGYFRVLVTTWSYPCWNIFHQGKVRLLFAKDSSSNMILVLLNVAILRVDNPSQYLLNSQTMMMMAISYKSFLTCLAVCTSPRSCSLSAFYSWRSISIIIGIQISFLCYNKN